MKVLRDITHGDAGTTEFTFRRTPTINRAIGIFFWTPTRGDEKVLVGDDAAILWRFILEDLGHTVIWEVE